MERFHFARSQEFALEANQANWCDCDGTMADNNHSEFSEQQTQQLQDIARNGAADEYGYGDNAQANGTTSSMNFTSQMLTPPQASKS